MNRKFAVYTVEAQCQDCYKCLRQCPVKAIHVERERAAIIPEACVACGRCVAVCPVGAKHIRDDLSRATLLLSRRRAVYLSLAPSYPAAFPGVAPAALISACRQLGFRGVSETALGAEQVNRTVAATLDQGAARVYLSTACPTAVDYISKYMPAMVPMLTPVVSPMVAHAQYLRACYGPEIGVVFAGPCIAKKCEADEHETDVDIALTFAELRHWMETAGVALETDTAAGTTAAFVPHAAREGALYPMAGGMNETLRPSLTNRSAQLLSVAGLRRWRPALEGLCALKPAGPVFVELLACEGGCLGGPCAARDAVLTGELEIRGRIAPGERPTDGDCAARIAPHPRPDVTPLAPEPAHVAAALASIGKHSATDELNCSGCGYDTCRAFAMAVVAGRAEPSMCLSNLRRKAQRKANALLRCMPSGVVIADAAMNIIECNENFARLFGDLLLSYEARPGLNGVSLAKAVPFADIFRRVLETGQDDRRELFRVGDRLLNLTVFTIEPRETVGGILQDATTSAQRREYIALQAREVITRNLSTVQDIAFKLGEHMADTEILLRSIADDYAGGEEPVA